MTLRRDWWTVRYGGSESNAGSVPAQEEIRRTDRSTVLAVATLACPECDAPIAVGDRSLTPAQQLDCPYCRNVAPLREFLSLEKPTRPTRVVVRVRMRAASFGGARTR
jgi:hypothetical protein